MNRKLVLISAAAAVVFDLIACLGDNNMNVFRIFMGLCIASFTVFVYALFRTQYSAEEKKKEAEEYDIQDIYVTE